MASTVPGLADFKHSIDGCSYDQYEVRTVDRLIPEMPGRGGLPIAPKLMLISLC